jgi:flagellin-specific chaperone FliS
MEPVYSPNEAVAAYAANQVSGASPGQLVTMLYEVTIKACRAGDTARARQGLIELSSGLNLDYLEVAGPLYRLYEFCLDGVQKGNFAEVEHLLSDLRQAWTEALDRTGQRTTAPRLEIREP